MTSQSELTRVLAFLLLSALIVTACRTGQDTGASAEWKRQARDLRLAGERMGVPIRPESMVLFAQSGVSLSIAAATNLESIPATRYPNGVDLGVAYLDLGEVTVQDSSKIPLAKGYYKLRGFADEAREIGKVGGHLQLIDLGGRIAAVLPADVEIQSLIPPPDAARRHSTLELDSRVTDRLLGRPLLICVRCTNGVAYCTHLIR